MSIVGLARPEIQSLHAYEAAEQVDDTVRLNANESPFPLAAGRFRRPLNRYPEVRPVRLRAALAERFGCDAGELLVTRGSSEAIDLVTRTFCRAGEDNIVTSSPAFAMYSHYAAVQGADFIEVPTRAEDDFAIDIGALLGACTDATRLVVLCSPNNPTGTVLPREQLERVLDERRQVSAVVVDEAYIEFGATSSAVDLLNRYPNLLVLRTLSKALGFAGARCGAVIGSPDVIRMLGAVQAPYAIATPVVECVEDALDDAQLAAAEKAVATVIDERERLSRCLADCPVVDKVWPSAANFLLVRFQDAERVMAHCKAHKILLRYFGAELPDCIRISVGSREDNDSLLRALDELGGS